MTEEILDANTGTAPEVEVEGDTPSVDAEFENIVDDDGLISTTEFKEVEPVKEIISEKTEQKIEPVISKEKDFNDHPRFKELIEQKNTFKSVADKVPELEKKLSALEQRLTQPEPKYKNILGMDNEKIIDDFNEDPKNFLANFAQQLRSEFQQEDDNVRTQKEQQTVQENTQKTYREFFLEREDGQEMLADGRIKNFITQNPGHNPMSAYHAIASGTSQKAEIDKAVAKAVADKEKEIYTNLKAKGNAGSKATTPGMVISDDLSAAEKHPDKFGGAKAVAARLWRQRAAG